jgi:DNA-binding transcriptional LysR family regulator
MMDLEDLRSFVTIVKEKSISKAAGTLHLAQPTLSARIRKLEESLGVRLLERNWDGVQLTERGQFFLFFAVQMIHQFHDASTILNKADFAPFETSMETAGSADRIVIGVDTGLSGLLMSPLAAQLQRLAPELKCKYVSRPSAALIDLIEIGAIDFGIFYGGIESAAVKSVHVLDDEWVLLCSERSISGVDPSDAAIDFLKHEMFVLFEPPLSTYISVWKILLQLFDTIPDKFQIVDSRDMMLGAVANAQGFTLVPRLYIPELYLEIFPIRIIPIGARLPKLPVSIASSLSAPAEIPIEPIRESLLSMLRHA